MKYLFPLLIAIFSLQSFAATLRFQHGTIAPFDARELTIEEFIKEYAELKDITVSVPSTGKFRKKVNLVTYSPITIDRLDDYFSQVLSSVDFYPHQINNTVEILSIRTGRYINDKFYISNNYPTKREYISVIHKLKYPVTRLIERSLRGLMSRNGRIYTFHGNSLLIKDYGNKIKSMLTIINEIDTKETYESYRKKLRSKAKAKSKQVEAPEEEKKKVKKAHSAKGAKHA